MERRRRFADGVERTFREMAWPDVLPVAGMLGRCRPDAAWMELVAAAMGNDLGAATMMDLAALMLSERYCDQPLTRDEIELGDHLDSTDIEALGSMAVELAGLTAADGTDTVQEGFDLDGVVFFVMREAGLSWDEVHDVTFEQLLWLHRQAVVHRVKYELPMHGIDTRQAVADLEAGEAGHQVDAAGTRALGAEEAKALKAEMGRRAKERTKVAAGTVAKLRSAAKQM